MSLSVQIACFHPTDILLNKLAYKEIFLASTALSCLNHNNNWLAAHFLRNIRLANNFEFLTPFQLNRRLVTLYLWSYRELQRGNNLTF